MIEKGKNAIVTGTSRSMDTLLCRMLAEKGVNLAICSVDAEALNNQAEELRNTYSVDVITHTVDMTK